MKTGGLSTPKIQAEIITRRAAGESLKQIGDTYGASKVSIYKVCKKNRDEIADTKNKMWADNIDNIVETFGMDMDNSKTMAEVYKSTGKITPAEVSYKVSTNKLAVGLLQGAGVFPSASLIQMNIDNSKTINAVDPVVFKQLTANFDTGNLQMNKPLIEAEVVDG